MMMMTMMMILLMLFLSSHFNVDLCTLFDDG
jgi:hypothetical protein